MLKRRINTVLDEIIQEEEKKEEKEKIDKELLRLNKPKQYALEEIKHKKNFEKMCAVLSMKTNKIPEQMTVLKYLQILEVIEQQNKKK